MITRIIVPTDGSETARKAARYAHDLALICQARITLVSVIDRGLFVGRPTVPASQTPAHILQPLEDFLRESAEADMEEIEKSWGKTPVSTRKVVRYGHPVEEIIAEAESSKADLIVMGSHGKSALEAALLGSVTFGVIHHRSKYPVLIVPK